MYTKQIVTFTQGHIVYKLYFLPSMELNIYIIVKLGDWLTD